MLRSTLSFTAALLISAPMALAAGPKLSVETIAKELRNEGYSAEIDAARRMSRVDGDEIIGVISTRIPGSDVSLQLHKCPDSKAAEICTINFVAFLPDGSNLITSGRLEAANSICAIAKVESWPVPNGKPSFSVSYNYVIGGNSDAKFLKTLLPIFIHDVGGVLDLYKSGFGAG